MNNFSMIIPAQATSSATDGMLGGWLNKLIANCEGALWGNTSSQYLGESGVWDLMIDTAAALAAVFSIMMAAKMAYEMMSEGKRLDVLKLLKPLTVALVLANWYFITSGIFGLVKPIENSAKAMYEWNNNRLVQLNHTRDSLDRRLTLVIGGLHATGEVSKYFMEQTEVTEKKEAEMNKAGDGEGAHMAESYSTVMYGDVINDAENAKTDANGNVYKPESVPGYTERVFEYQWVEDVILWCGEVVWTTGLYAIFLLKYLFLYVLVMFGPIYWACSLLGAWEDKWAEWLARYTTVCFFGTCGYLALSFGMMIINYSVQQDISMLAGALKDNETVLAYIKETGGSDWSNFETIGMYFVALCVSAVTLSQFHTLAGFIFPGNIGKAAGSFYNGFIGFAERKEQQARKAAEDLAIAAVTAGVGAAAAAEAAALDSDLAAQAGSELAAEAATTEGGEGSDIFRSEHDLKEEDREFKKAKEHEEESAEEEKTAEQRWMEEAEEAEMERERREGQIYSDNILDVVEGATGPANRMADRLAHRFASRPGSNMSGEDFAAMLRDEKFEQLMDEIGHKEMFRDMVEDRYNENLFLLKIVQSGATQLPILTSFSALRDKDTTASPRALREILKKYGMYHHIMRAEFLNRVARMLLVKHKHKGEVYYTFRNSLQKKYYERLMANQAKIQAQLAMKCRNILAARDIHVNSRGEVIYIPGADLYWRREVGMYDWLEASKNGNLMEDSFLEWFFGRYGEKDKAEELLLELDVLEAKIASGAADDFVLEKQLKAKSDEEREMWGQMKEHYSMYSRIRGQAESIIDYYNRKNKK